MFEGNIDLTRLQKKLQATEHGYSVDFYMDSHSFGAAVKKDGHLVKFMSSGEFDKFVKSTETFESLA